MSKKAVVTGQFNLVDETTNTNFLSFDLAAEFGTITGIGEHTHVERDLIDTDTVVTISMGGVTTLKGFFISVSGSGTVIVKHDSNTNGIEVSNAMLFFGEISNITIETAATQALTVQYIVFE